MSGAVVSVVVCTHLESRYDQLLACLSSLAQQTHRPSEVVVVVDGCEEVSARLARRSGPEAVVTLPVNRGLSTARNIGVSQVSTRWVAFLDDDAVAEPTWLEHLVRVCEERGTAGASGWSEPVFPAGVTPRWFPEELLWTVGCSYRGLPTRTGLVRNVFGGCALLLRELFDVVGGFDATLGRQATGFGGGEEADFCLRASAADQSATFAHVPDAVIRHRVPGERARVRYVLARCHSDGASKGRIARSSRSALGSERAFVTSVPAGALRHLRAGRPDAAAVLLLGVAAAAAGYLRARVTPRRPVRRSSSRPAPESQPGEAAHPGPTAVDFR
jgi:GT2 family glycosyltransferase